MKTQSYWSHTFIPELVRPDGTTFDFGVNNGGFCNFVAPLCQEVIGFEPDPNLFEALSVPKNVTVYRKALAAKRGLVNLNVNSQKCSSLHYSDRYSRRVQAEAVTLEDAIATARSERIEMVKMDIEGEETAVLREAPALVLQRIVQITVEFHDFLDSTHVPRIEAILDRMRSLNFHIINISLRHHADVLCINTKALPLSMIARAQLQASKLAQAAVRVPRRHLLGLPG